MYQTYLYIKAIFQNASCSSLILLCVEQGAPRVRIISEPALVRNEISHYNAIVSRWGSGIHWRLLCRKKGMQITQAIILQPQIWKCWDSVENANKKIKAQSCLHVFELLFHCRWNEQDVFLCFDWSTFYLLIYSTSIPALLTYNNFQNKRLGQ